jgi:hypothetical protein
MVPTVSPNTENPILEDFEESPQEPTVLFNIPIAIIPTGFYDFQLNEVISSTRSTLITSDTVAVFSHKPKPSLVVTLTISTGRIVKAASLSPPP